MNDVALLSRVLLGLVFGVSSLTKLRDPGGFARGVERFHLMPSGLVALASMALIILEAVVALALILGFATQFAIIAAVALILFFIGLMIRNTRRGESLPCYCFGTGNTDVRPRVVLSRLGFLLLLALAVVAGWIEGGASLLTRPTADLVLLASLGLVLGAWLLQLPELREWHRTTVPEFATPGTRVSMRGVPFDVSPRWEEVIG